MVRLFLYPVAKRRAVLLLHHSATAVVCWHLRCISKQIYTMFCVDLKFSTFEQEEGSVCLLSVKLWKENCLSAVLKRHRILSIVYLLLKRA